MATGLDKLMLQVGLIDQVTKPLKGITQQVNTVSQAGKDGFTKMAGGTAGLVAAGVAVQSALMPAIEMDRRMGEVASLGTTDKAMKELKQTAFGFSIEYGKSAAEFVDASYDIQSAIAGLKGDELARFTKASAVLAAATKADTKTITAYMGTMYGIFKNQAAEMGNAEWVDQVAGMTAKAVQMFKTTGSEMSSAFTSLGADATSVGVGMNEQMAVLGTLQATMSGSEAGTKYRAFLGGVAKAQKELNMTFVDGQGQLLPMVKILGKLKERYGETIDVAESAELQKAFGTKEATGMIKLLMADTEGLASNIEALGQVKGIDVATKMAKAQTDQWERLEHSWFTVRAFLGGLILPAFNALAGTLADGSVVLMGYMEKYPTLTKYLGFAIMAVLGIGAAAATFAVISGIASMAVAGWGSSMLVFSGISAGLNAVMGVMKGIIMAVNAVMYANPIGLVVAVIGLLVAGVAAAIYWWDDLKASFGDSKVFQMLGNVIDWVIDKINMIPGIDIETKFSTDMPTMPELVADREESPANNVKKAEINQMASNYLRGTTANYVPQQGLYPQMTRMNNPGKTVHIGDVTVVQKDKSMSIAELDEQQELASG